MSCQLWDINYQNKKLTVVRTSYRLYRGDKGFKNFDTNYSRKNPSPPAHSFPVFRYAFQNGQFKKNSITCLETIRLLQNCYKSYLVNCTSDLPSAISLATWWVFFSSLLNYFYSVEWIHNLYLGTERTIFHYHPSSVLIWLRYCQEGLKLTNNSSIHCSKILNSFHYF